MILLTGATGFIGRHVLSNLLTQNNSVVAIVRPSSVGRLQPHPRLKLCISEDLNIERNDIVGVDTVIHLAAHGVVDGLNDWERCFDVNLRQSLALWRKAADVGVRRFIICGSCFEYGRSGERYEYIPVDAPLEPTGPYAASKASATMAALALALEYKLELVIARPFHVYGEGEVETRFWPSLRRAAISGSDFPMTLGEQVRDFVHVEDVASVIVRKSTRANVAAEYPYIGNIGSGNPQTLREFAERWWSHWEARGKLILGAVPYRKNEVMRYVPRITAL